MLAMPFRKLSDSVPGRRLFNTLVRTPAHFPEVGLEPGGFLEDHDQLCLAGRRGVEIGETLKVRPRFRRDLLVWCTGIFGLGLLASGLVAFALGRGLVRPLSSVCGVMDRLAKGDLNVEVPFVDRRNEIGHISRSLAVEYDLRVDSVGDLEADLRRRSSIRSPAR